MRDAQVFSSEILVRFGDCDPAGIVFYPRYFEMFNGVVEDWCARGLGFSFRAMHMEQRMGLPAVRIETDFVTPSELGDVLSAELRVEKLGNASVTVSIRLCGADGEDRVRSRLVLVMMDLDERSAVRIEDALRARIAAFCVAP